MLIQDTRYISTIHGAEMAIEAANKNGGFNGQKFQLVVRSMEGPWGAGSKQAVDLIFEENVWGLLGSHDGRNAHLVEQAATKSTVVFISAWSGDPTLSQAFVPWFFNCVPNDLQQSIKLLEEIQNKRNLQKIGIIYSNDYDSKMMLNNFSRTFITGGKPDHFLINFETYSERIQEITEHIRLEKPDCILIFCRPDAALKVIRQIKISALNLPVFGPFNILNENELSENELMEFDNLIAVPSGDWQEKKLYLFRSEFQKKYGIMPGFSAAFAFDGMSLLIEAIKNAKSPERETIQHSLERINYSGISGNISFDKRGNRSGKLVMTTIKNGLPVLMR